MTRHTSTLPQRKGARGYASSFRPEEGVGNAGCYSRTRGLAWENKNHTS
jgi:hypothetical protein